MGKFVFRAIVLLAPVFVISGCANQTITHDEASGLTVFETQTFEGPLQRASFALDGDAEAVNVLRPISLNLRNIEGQPQDIELSNPLCLLLDGNRIDLSLAAELNSPEPEADVLVCKIDPGIAVRIANAQCASLESASASVVIPAEPRAALGRLVEQYAEVAY